MAFCIIVGSHKFTKEMEEFKDKKYECRYCHNMEAYCRKTWQWGTVCWIPLIPFSLGWHEDVLCRMCNRKDDLSQRPDITTGQGPQGQPLPQVLQGPQGQPYQQGPMGGGYSGPPQQQEQYK